tara:strand:- start:1529 stop:2446 length:918 start_codon:yes stop_codon:yes gene_type:complete
MAESMQQVEEAVEETVEIEVEEATTEEAPVLEEVEAQPAETETEPEKDVSDEEEIVEYSESVKKRINKLTYKIREAERREQAAIEYAKGVQEKLNTTQANLSQKDQSLYDEYSARVDTQLQSAEERYKQAHDIGDTEAMLAAQKDVAKLAVEQESLTRVKPEPQTEETPVEVPQAQQQPVEQVAEPDPKAQEWASKNEWFGEDLAMTTSAFAFHRQLVEKEGFDPASDEYYLEVDRRMAKAFPHKFNTGGEVSQLNNNVQEPVANSSRGTRGKAGKARTVKLSPSQVAIAKRLGVPLEEYAKHVK